MRKNNRRTALILLSIVLVFFLGIVLKQVLLH
ncbi:cytochrome oxidase small assembly protein [Imbroritus primus]